MKNLIFFIFLTSLGCDKKERAQIHRNETPVKTLSLEYYDVAGMRLVKYPRFNNFFISQTEITQKSWDLLYAPRTYKNYYIHYAYLPYVKKPKIAIGDHFPVVAITVLDIERFCQELTMKEKILGNIKEDMEFRLLTNQEWIMLRDTSGLKDEQFCRKTSILSQVILARDGSYCSKVATRNTDNNGLYDFLGNVFEIVSNKTSVRKGLHKDVKIKIRGGAYFTDVRSAYTMEAELGIDEKNINTGFRVCLAPRQKIERK